MVMFWGFRISRFCLHLTQYATVVSYLLTRETSYGRYKPPIWNAFLQNNLPVRIQIRLIGPHKDRMAPGSRDLKSIARMRMSDEFSDCTLYDRLAKTVGNDSPFKEVLENLSVTERRHFEFWRKYVPDEQPRIAKLKLYWVLFLRRFLGLTFATRYLDRHEENVVEVYEGLARMIPESDRAAYEEMVADEREHEKAFAMKVESSAVQYISFVVLGLADALVEI